MNKPPLRVQAMLVDMAFFGLGAFCFYNSFVLAGIAILIVGFLAYRRYAYVKSLYPEHFNHFIEFLNHLDAHLSVGLNFKRAVLACSDSEKMSLKPLGKIIQMNGTDQDLFEALKIAFPIPDVDQFTGLINQALVTGASTSKIVSITLERLHLKHQLENEVDVILFQKKLEQSILCIAPLVIILMLRQMASDFLTIMYTSLQGRLIMSFSFLILIVMKIVSEKIVKIKTY